MVVPNPSRGGGDLAGKNILNRGRCLRCSQAGLVDTGCDCFQTFFGPFPQGRLNFPPTLANPSSLRNSQVLNAHKADGGGVTSWIATTAGGKLCPFLLSAAAAVSIPIFVLPLHDITPISSRCERKPVAFRKNNSPPCIFDPLY